MFIIHSDFFFILENSTHKKYVTKCKSRYLGTIDLGQVVNK